jgi:membrane-associated phospholipid phosphatase
MRKGAVVMKQTRYETAIITLSCLLVFSPKMMGTVQAANVANMMGIAMTANPVENSGNILLFALPASAVGLSLFHEDFSGLLQYGASAALTDGATLILKDNVYELRPNGSDYLSFPSGHSSTTFAAAAYIQRRYGWGLGIAAYALAAFTGYSRIESKEHYFHDVAAGAAIGVSSSYLFTKPFHHFNIRPTTDGKHIGVTVSTAF